MEVSEGAAADCAGTWTRCSALTSQQAQARLQRFGPNEIAEKHQNPVLALLGYFWAHATLIAVYGVLMTPLGWGWAGFVWAYACSGS